MIDFLIRIAGTFIFVDVAVLASCCILDSFGKYEIKQDTVIRLILFIVYDILFVMVLEIWR